MVRHSVFQIVFTVSCLSVSMPLWGAVNVGPPSSGGHLVGEPVGIRDVAITREALSIDLRPLAHDGLVQVEAVYHLDNRGEQQTLDLLFAGGSKGVKQFQVWLDGDPVEAAPDKDAHVPESWQAPEHTPSLQGGRPLDYIFYGGSRLVPMAFTVTIPPGPQILKVRYVAEATKNLLGYPTVYRQFAYVLAPARSWAGFGGLDVVIRLPESWTAACSPFLRRDGDRLTGSFDVLPADSFALTVQAPEGHFYAVIFYGSLALFSLALIGGGIFCWSNGRATGHRWASQGRDGSNAPLPRVWPRALGLGATWSSAILATGLIAIFAPDFSLPANQVAHYGYGQPLAVIGLFFLTAAALPLGFAIAHTTTNLSRLAACQ